MPRVETNVIRPQVPHARRRSALDLRLEAAHEAVKRALVRHVRANPFERTVPLSPSPEMTYRHGGAVKAVDRFDIITFADLLATKRLAAKVEHRSEGVSIELSERALNIFKASATPSDGQYRPIVGSPEFDRIKVGGTSGQLTPKARAKALLLPILRLTSTHMATLDQIAAVLASDFRIPKDRIAAPSFDGGHSVASLAKHCVDYLLVEGLLLSNGRQFCGSPTGRGIVHGSAEQTWKGFTEPAAAVGTVKGELRTKPAADLGNLPDRLAGMTTDQTLNLWHNANRLLASADKAAMHEQARAVIEAISYEWASRADGDRPDAKKQATSGPRSSKGRKKGPEQESDREGMLAYMDYHVGYTAGRDEAVRRSILTRVFEETLPPVFEREYMTLWGANGSPRRLKKMAGSIARFCKIGKSREEADMSLAIEQWEADLAFLKKAFYGDEFLFRWPDTDLEDSDPDDKSDFESDIDLDFRQKIVLRPRRF